MTRAGLLVRLSVRLYALLLVAYPAAFRRAYGPDMVQVFRDGCHDAARQAGVPGLFTVWGHTLGDLAASGWRERVAAAVSASSAALHFEGGPSMPQPHQIERWLPYPLILLLGLGVGYVNLHTDQTPFIALPLLAAAALVSFIHPRAAWHWGLLLGLWPALSAAWALAINMKVPYPNTVNDLSGPLIGGLLFALAGAYFGVLARWIVRQLGAETTSSH